MAADRSGAGTVDVAELVAQLQRPSPAARVAQAAPVRPGPTITLTDRQPYTQGPYFAWIGPWNVGALKAGKDYTESMILDTAAFPDRTALRWNWPAAPPPGGGDGVYGFLGLQFGDYYGTAVQRPVPPRRLMEIARLTQTHAFAVAGTLDGFDVLTDYFLTAEPGRHERHLFEIEVFWHAPPYAKAYAGSVTQLGTYTEAGGRAWTVAKNPRNAHGPAILLVPADGAVRGRATMDLQALHLWLIARGVLTGREWFNGLAFGVEVRQEGGSMAVDAFAVDYR